MFNPISLSSVFFKKYLKTGKHPFKVRIQNLLGKHLFGKGISVVNKTGTRFCLLANDWITRTILLKGEYEGESIKLAEKLLENGGVFVDIGANFGLYTCILSANKNVRVYAIEPNYIVVPALLKNVALNRRDNVTVLNTALSSDVQFVGFSLENPNNLGMASFEVKKNASFSVLSCPLNFIFESQKIPTAELIKIDIEGYEPRMILGAHNLITDNHPIIMIEVFPKLWSQKLTSEWEATLDFLMKVYSGGLICDASVVRNFPV